MVKFQKFKAFRQNKNLDNNYRSLVIEYDDQQGSPKIKMIDTNNRFVLRTQSLSSPSVSNRNQLHIKTENSNGKFHYEMSKLEINKILLHRESNYSLNSVILFVRIQCSLFNNCMF